MKAVLSERGQITIPKALRDRLGLRPGQALDFQEEDGRLVAVKIPADDPVGRFYGALGGRTRSDHLIGELRDGAER